MHRDVQQERVRLVALDQYAGSPGRVDHDPDPHGAGAAVLVGEAERDAVAVKGCVSQSMLLEHLGAALLGVAKQDFVEFFSQDLKRLRRGRLPRVLEVGVPLVRAVRSPEARAPLLDEARCGDRVAHAESPEDLVGPRQLRLADVKARKPLALQHDDLAAPLGQRRGARGAARAPTDDRHVVIPSIARAAHASSRGSCIHQLSARRLGVCPGNAGGVRKCVDTAGAGLVECAMAKTFREWSVQQQLLLPPSVLDFVPPDHLAHFVRDTVAEELDLSAIVETYDEERGYPPYHPVMMTALLLYAYCQRIYSSRRIARACAERVDFMAVTALQRPDFRTIATFRRRHLAPLRALFQQVLVLCRRAGLVRLGHVALDGTKIRANASKHKAMSYRRMQEREPA